MTARRLNKGGIIPSCVAGILIAAIGLFVLLGWALGISWMKTVLPGAVDMKANTAVGFLLAGMALCMLNGSSDRNRQILGQFLALTVALLGLLTLSEYFFGWRLGIDELLFRDPTGFHGLMSVFSAAVFAAVGLGLAVVSVRPLRWFIWIGAFVAFVVGGVSFVGYLWKASELVTGRFIPPLAVNTAVGFIILGLGAALMKKPLPGEGAPDVPGPLSGIEIKSLAGFLATILLLLLGGAKTYRAAVDSSDSAQLVSHTEQVRAGLWELYAGISNAESRERDYLLSGDDQYVENSRKFGAEALKEADDLAQLISDNRAQTQRIRELRAVLERRIAALEHTSEMYKSGGFESAQAAILTGEGRRMMAAIRELVQRMDSAESELLSARETTRAHDQVNTLVFLLATLGIAIIGCVLLFRGIHREMKGRAGAEETLRRSEENLAVTLQSIGDGVLATDAQRRITRLNPIAEKLTGWTQAEAVGRVVDEVFRIVNEETREPSLIPVEKVIATGEIHGLANHTILIARDGSEKPIADSAAPIRDKGGQIIGVVLVFRDMTEERQAQLQVRERSAQLEEANKELESFSYSVSHDLRAPLRHVQGYAQMLEAALEGEVPEKARRYLKNIREASFEMGHLIDDLLAFSRMGRGEISERPVAMDTLVETVIKSFDLVIQGRNIAWKIAPLPRVLGDATMLKQALANLIGNAVKYTSHRENAEIEIGRAGMEGDRIIFFVKDNGAGFDMQYAHKLFGVFQRLHRAEEFEGTGIGLAIVRRVITRHGGRIWAEARVDEGAAFYFTLKPAPPAS